MPAVTALPPAYPLDSGLDADGRFQIGGCDAVELAATYGTPAYVVAEEDLRRRARSYLDALASHHAGPGTVLFAMKAFPATAVVRTLAEEGCGALVASGGELHVALKAGVAPERIAMHGNAKSTQEIEDAVAAGIGYLTEDRKGEGLALQLGVDQNITLARLPARFGFINLAEERRIARRRRDELNIRTPSIRRKVQVLSGGNQQKVVVARWLETRARVMFFDEPARGIDVGAKAEMFGLIEDLAKEGRAIVMISSYLPELLNMCDRILVMHEGEVAGVIPREEFSEERVMALAAGMEETA